MFLLKRKLDHQQEARRVEALKFEREREALQTEKKNVKAANIGVEKKLDSSNEQLIKVNAKSVLLAKKLRFVEERKTELESSLRDELVKNRKSQSDNENLKEQVIGLIEDVNLMTRQYSALSEDNEQLSAKKVIKKLTIREVEVLDVKLIFETNDEKLADKLTLETAKKFESDGNELQMELDKVMAEKLDIKKELDSSVEKMERLKCDFLEVTDSLNESKQKNEHLSDQLSETRTQSHHLATTLHSLEKKTDELQSKLDGSVAENHELHEMLDAVKAENTQLLRKSTASQDNILMGF